MIKIGVTGHQHLKSINWEWSIENIRSYLCEYNDVIGITCLAAGADQIFAELVLEQNGQIISILPYENIIESFIKKSDRQKFQELLSKSKQAITLPTADNKELAYLNAGKKVVDCCERMIAVWNEQPSEGLGGTADIVKYAQSQSKPVSVFNPYKRKISQLV